MFFRRKKGEAPEEKLNHMISRYEKRLAILEAIVFVSENYMSVMEIILRSEDSKDAKERLCKIYRVSEAQSQAIIDTRIKTLTKAERKKLLEECQECRSRYEELLKERSNLEIGFKEEK